MNKDRYLVVVSGPSGSGKDTVVNRLRQLHPEIEVSVSATSRAMRPGEAEGVNYYYMTREQFEQKLAAGEILEHTCYCGNYYGTPKSEVDRRIEQGITVVLVIEVEGAGNIRRLYPEATTIFVAPPSLEELEHRLRGRGTESEEAIQGRLARAREELALADQYTATVVNQEVDDCARQLYEIIRARQEG